MYCSKRIGILIITALTYLWFFSLSESKQVKWIVKSVLGLFLFGPVSGCSLFDTLPQLYGDDGWGHWRLFTHFSAFIITVVTALLLLLYSVTWSRVKHRSNLISLCVFLDAFLIRKRLDSKGWRTLVFIKFVIKFSSYIWMGSITNPAFINEITNF